MLNLKLYLAETIFPRFAWQILRNRPDPAERPDPVSSG